MIDIQQQLSELPKEVRTWISSERVTHLVGGINNGLNLKSEDNRRIIPRLILRLVTQDIASQDVIKELSDEFDISPSSARVIAEEIDKRILQPIQKQLFNDVGVDTKLIFLKSSDFFAPPKESITKKLPDIEDPEHRRGIDEQKDGRGEGPKIIERQDEETQSAPSAQKFRAGIAREPLIVRREERIRPISDPQLRREHTAFQAPKKSTPPVSADIQLGAAPRSDNSGAVAPQRAGEQKRVVHYGGYRTMLSPAPKEMEVNPTAQAPKRAPASTNTHNGEQTEIEAKIDLRTFSRVAEETPDKTPRFPNAKQPSQTEEVRAKGNLLDLRNEKL